VIATGNYKDIAQKPVSITGQYMSGKKSFPAGQPAS
jgi:excinuclease UvrABC ATPase subunit